MEEVVQSTFTSPLCILSLDVLDKSIFSDLSFNSININRNFNINILDEYSRTIRVQSEGEFSVAGDTYTIFIKNSSYIVRIELFGDTVEHISLLDNLTLRRIKDLSQVTLIKNTITNITNSENNANISEDEYLIKYNIEEEPQTIVNFYSQRSVYEEDIYFHLPIYVNKEKLWETDLVKYIREEYSVFYYGQNAQAFKEKLEESIQKEFVQNMLTSVFNNNPQKEKTEKLNKFINNAKYIESSNADKGFYSNKEKVVYFSDQEIFGTLFFKSSIQNKNISKLFDGEIKIGDYIVHDLHGVGIYQGLITQQVGDEEKDYIKIEYLNNDILYVPYEAADKVSKYVGEGSNPHLTRLGSAEWDTVRTNAKKDIEELAGELLDLYARRELEKGFSYDVEKTKEMFEELLSDFGYEDTPDQKRTTMEVLDDMESEKPMDRLLVGDVGFGKTEIAVRAAFLAVLNKKQVIVLAPTTILVSQLYKVFVERLAKFGVTLAKVSRFEGEKKNKDAVKNFTQGGLDIIIGTHRLLSRDVHVKDLGLLIIDEEQRFGVKQKETIKNIKANIDVLSMSATPIPRTLQMSLSGIRDISIISTPPQGRLSVITKLAARGEIYSPIRDELSRNGQVFVVHNNISTIDTLARKIAEKVPEAKIIVGHAKMTGTKLEKIMLDFSDKKYNVLIATTIIENGIDIPSVNTMIVDEATHFGLSQLHQLRGRVGRSNIQAYCYLVVPYRLDKGKIDEKEIKKFKNESVNNNSLDENAIDSVKEKKEISIEGVERIKAILEYQALGAGFHIASKDLEIRGSGKVLGSSQSGHINSMGYDMYLRMLYQEIDKRKKILSNTSTV